MHKQSSSATHWVHQLAAYLFAMTLVVIIVVAVAVVVNLAAGG